MLVSGWTSSFLFAGWNRSEEMEKILWAAERSAIFSLAEKTVARATCLS
jgi:hypothetical protein